MSGSHESIPQQPSREVEEAMHLDGNGYRNINFRGVETALPEGQPTLGSSGVETGFSNPAYGGDTDLEQAARQAPNAYVELANMQNRRDHDELTATQEEIDRIKESPLAIFQRRKLGRLADRVAVLDPNGDMNESHKRFVAANQSALIENARTEAASEGVEINNDDRAA